MTDETAKKAWARCPACSTVYPNIQIAKDGHRLNCPYDIKLALEVAVKKIAELEGKIANLGGNLDELSSEPGVDFFGVDEDTVDETPVESILPDDPITPSATADDDSDWDDDEDSLQSVPTIR